MQSPATAANSTPLDAALLKLLLLQVELSDWLLELEELEELEDLEDELPADDQPMQLSVNE